MKKSAHRYSVAQAKARLSELLRAAEDEPAVIHNRGRDVAVVLSIEDYRQLRASAGVAPTTRWRARLEEWRLRTGGVDFEPQPLDFKPRALDFEGPSR